MVMSLKLTRAYLTTEMIIEIISDITPSLIEYIYPEIISKIISAPNNAPAVVVFPTVTYIY